MNDDYRTVTLNTYEWDIVVDALRKQVPHESRLRGIEMELLADWIEWKGV